MSGDHKNWTTRWSRNEPSEIDLSDEPQDFSAESLSRHRERARQVARILGADPVEQLALAETVIELGSALCSHESDCHIQYRVTTGTPPRLRMEFSLKTTPEHLGKQRRELRRAVRVADRLCDHIELDIAAENAAIIRFEKMFSAHEKPFSRELIEKLRLAVNEPPGRDGEPSVIHEDLINLLLTVERLSSLKASLEKELDQTNRGVVALYTELEDQAASLRHMSELKSRFLSILSHEFRTPLTSILGFSQLLLSDGLTSDQNEQVAMIRNSAQMLSELVNDLLDISKIEAGKMGVKPVDFEAAHMLETLEGAFNPIAREAGLDLIIDYPRSIPPLHTDQEKLTQILRNFISNALKFTPEGEVRVHARYGIDDSVTFFVTDTGIGIAPEDQELIFDEYIQLADDKIKRLKGTGLGLPLCRELARLLGGDVAVESEAGKGSSFRVTVPRVFSQTADATAPQDKQAKKASSRVADSFNELTASSNILLVETSRNLGDLLRIMMERQGHVVSIAGSPEAANELLQNDSWDVVVADLDGFQCDARHAALQLREHGSATTFIAISECHTSDKLQEIFAAGFDVHLPKPITPQQLLTALAQIRTKRATAAENERQRATM